MRDAAEMMSAVTTARLNRELDERECKRRNALSQTSPGLVLRSGDVGTVRGDVRARARRSWSSSARTARRQGRMRLDGRSLSNRDRAGLRPGEQLTAGPSRAPHAWRRREHAGNQEPARQAGGRGQADPERGQPRVPKGQVHAIMGPNGSGKSTLAYVLAGREGYEVTGGDVLWNGEDLLGHGARRARRQGRVPGLPVSDGDPGRRHHDVPAHGAQCRAQKARARRSSPRPSS